jgi:type IV pilus assembly protein PilE
VPDVPGASRQTDEVTGMTTTSTTWPVQERGFTLIELMITVVIVAILASIALPSYQNHLQKARRADAYDCLLNAAQRQENYFYQNNTYASTIGALGMDAQSCGDGDYYELKVTTENATSYLLTASRVAGSPQIKDTRCGDLTLSSAGEKSNNGSLPGSDCW